MPSRRAVRGRGFAFLICLSLALTLADFGEITPAQADSGSPARFIPSTADKTDEADVVAGPHGGIVQVPVASSPTRAADEDAVRTGGTSTADHELPLSAPTFTNKPDPIDSRQTGTDGGDRPTIVDVLHAHVSRGIQETATWMDSFFGDARYESELNESYVRVQYDMFKEEGEDVVTPKPDVRIRIVLPELRRKTRLVLSGTSKERADFSALETEPEKTSSGGGRERSAGVEQTLVDSLSSNLSIRVALRMHDKKPSMTFGPRYRLLLPLESWQLRFVEDVTWMSHAGWASTATFDAERRLLTNHFFRASNSWNWVEGTDGVIYAVSFGIARQIDDSRALGYEWVNAFRTRPVHELSEVALRARYRQRLFRREWVYFEAAPQYRFPRSHSFRGLAGILFRLEVLFGNYR